MTENVARAEGMDWKTKVLLIQLLFKRIVSEKRKDLGRLAVKSRVDEG